MFDVYYDYVALLGYASSSDLKKTMHIVGDKMIQYVCLMATTCSLMK